MPTGKCDAGLTWGKSCYQGSWPWFQVTGTAYQNGPNKYMQLSQPGGIYKRAPLVNGTCVSFKPVLSETYVHLWGKNYDLNRAHGGQVSATEHEPRWRDADPGRRRQGQPGQRQQVGDDRQRR